MSDRSFLVELDAGGALHGLVLEAEERVNAAFVYRVTVAHEAVTPHQPFTLARPPRVQDRLPPRSVL